MLHSQASLSLAQPLGPGSISSAGRGPRLSLSLEGDPQMLTSFYPRCATDHNSDNTTAMLQEWLWAVGKDYHSVVLKVQEEPR